jgi:predicted Zn-dependent protease with MMP-like domain
MTRERFIRLVEESLAQLPLRFRGKIQNLAIVVEDLPPEPEAPGEELLMGIFEGIPATERSAWESATFPARIVLYQKNIEAVCASDAEIREEVRLTLLHELGHYFGMSEDQLEDV